MYEKSLCRSRKRRSLEGKKTKGGEKKGKQREGQGLGRRGIGGKRWIRVDKVRKRNSSRKEER